MVGKSVATGALVSGAVLAAPAAAETSLRRLANSNVSTYDSDDQTVTVTFTQMLADLVTADGAPPGIREAISAALLAAGLQKEDGSTPPELVAADITAANFGATSDDVDVTEVHGNTITFSYRPILAGVNLSPDSAVELAKLIPHDGERHEEFQRRIGVAVALSAANAAAHYNQFRAPTVHDGSVAATAVSGSLQLGFQLPAGFEADDTELDTFETKVIAKIRESLDHLDDMCPTTNTESTGTCVSGYPNNRSVVGNDVRFSFTVTPEVFGTPSFELDDKYDEIKRTLGAGTTAAEQDLRNAFRLEVMCRLKDETLPTGVTWANAPSDTMCNEILGTTDSTGSGGSGSGGSDESSDESSESSSARSVAVVSFLSTAAAAAALF